MDPNRPQFARAPLTWTPAQTFKVEGTELVVIISKSDQRIPQYSLKAGRLIEAENRFLPFVAVRVQDQRLGQVRLGGEIDGLIEALGKAKEWITQDAAWMADRITTEREEIDLKKASFGKPVTRVTGKTAKRKARLASLHAKV